VDNPKYKAVKYFPFAIALALFQINILHCQTIIPGGYICGTWNAAGSPYIILDDVLVHGDSTLTLNAGTTALFTGPHFLEVHGQLLVNGTPTDPVTFDRENDTVSWRGIFLNYTDTSMSDSSILQYGSISHTSGGSCLTIHHSSRVRVSHFSMSYGESFRGGGINCRFSDPMLEYLTVEHNHTLDGAGIALENSDALLCHCTVQLNVADGAGGGMVIFDQSSPVLDSCFIGINSASGSGGGIYINDSWPVIRNSTINHNSGAQGGGTLYSGGGISVKLDSEPVFENCRIYSNTSFSNGGGIASFSPTRMVNCLFLDDFSYGEGGAIYLGSGNPVTSHLYNCTFDHNTAPYGAMIACYNHILVARNSILWDKWNISPTSVIYLNSITALDVADIDYCDVIHGEACIQLAGNAGYAWGQNNIDDYPGWEATGHALAWNSPCIEAGTPDTTGLGLPETDLSGQPRIINTRVDMGAYESQQPVEIPGSGFLVQEDWMVYPNPTREAVFVEMGAITGKNSLQILSAEGKVLFETEMSSQRVMLNTEGFQQGLYFVRFLNDSKTSVKKLIII
jgi:hypothetical protein